MTAVVVKAVDMVVDTEAEEKEEERVEATVAAAREEATVEEARVVEMEGGLVAGLDRQMEEVATGTEAMEVVVTAAVARVVVGVEEAWEAVREAADSEGAGAVVECEVVSLATAETWGRGTPEQTAA